MGKLLNLFFRFGGWSRDDYTRFLRHKTGFGDKWDPRSYGSRVDRYTAMDDEGIEWTAEVSDNGVDIYPTDRKRR